MEDEVIAEQVPGESVQLDQLQPDDSIDRGVSDVLDEGYVPPDRWSPAQGFGNTPAEMRRGETIEQRVKQDYVEPERLEGDWNPNGEPRQVGSERAGRLTAVSNDGKYEDTFGSDVGIDGGAASAEEAAVHVIDESGEELDS